MTDTSLLPPQIACGALPDPSGLLQAVIAFPEEDTPRLVYADWLEEFTDQHDRAELIRVQCELARIIAAGTADPKRHIDPGSMRSTTPPDFARWKELDRREARLGEWLRNVLPIPTRTRGPNLLTVDRGFVSLCSCDWQQWAAHGDALRAREWVPRVKLDAPPLWNARGYDGAPFILHGDPATVAIPDEDVGKLMRQARGTDGALGITDAVLALRYPGTVFEFAT